jgi:cyanophycinase
MMHRSLSAFLLFIIALVLIDSVTAGNSTRSGAGWDYYCVGNCDVDVKTPTVGGAMLLGGGGDVDDAFRWLISNSGGGDILVLRASGTDAYNEYIYDLGRVNSVATFVITSRDASSDPFVLEKLQDCEGLFFGGGDQALYYRYWKDTQVETIINDLIRNKRVTVGGTSAGMAIQSQFIYTALTGSVISEEALVDPYDSYITIGDDLVIHPYLQNVITDTHFYERDRMGRSVAFIARLLQDSYVSSSARGIACDEGTAVIISESGIGKVLTNSRVAVAYFLESTEDPTVCRRGVPLEFRDVRVYALNNLDEFDLRNWRSSDGRLYYLTASNGRLYYSGNGGDF